MRKAIFLNQSFPVFPVPDVEKTSDYYRRVLGFEPKKTARPASGILLVRDKASIILTRASSERIFTNRSLCGDGCDAYFTTDNLAELQTEWAGKNARIVKPLSAGEFILEDIDGRWIGFGEKMAAETSLFAWIPEF